MLHLKHISITRETELRLLIQIKRIVWPHANESRSKTPDRGIASEGAPPFLPRCLSRNGRALPRWRLSDPRSHPDLNRCNPSISQIFKSQSCTAYLLPLNPTYPIGLTVDESLQTQSLVRLAPPPLDFDGCRERLQHPPTILTTRSVFGRCPVVGRGDLSLAHLQGFPHEHSQPLEFTHGGVKRLWRRNSGGWFWTNGACTVCLDCKHPIK
jgi:hypothetical protein